MISRQRKAPVRRTQCVAVEWACHSRDRSRLSSGKLLQEITEPVALIGVDSARNPPVEQAKRDFLLTSDRACRRDVHRRHEVITGLLALILTVMTATGTATHSVAHAIQRPAIGQPRQLAVESLAIAIDSTHLRTPGGLTAAAQRISPTGRTGLVTTTPRTKNQESSILLVKSSGVNGVAFSPDGKMLAGAYGSGVVRLWDRGTGQPVGSPLQAGSAVNGVAFSPDGKLVASADADGTVRAWDPASGQPVGSPLQAGSAVNGVAFSPDGKMLVGAAADGTVRAWDTPAGQPSGTDSDHWFIIVASVIAIAVSALTVAITARGIRASK